MPPLGQKIAAGTPVWQHTACNCNSNATQCTAAWQGWFMHCCGCKHAQLYPS